MAALVENSFSGQHIFITGSTGFVGKVLVEKILRSLPNVSKLYLLIRAKKDQSPQDRMNQEVIASPAFDPLRKSMGEEEFANMVRNKVVAVHGSLTEPQMGISNEDYAMLVQNCTMILHLAATIDFNERLDTSARLNVLGALQVLSLARKCHERGGFDAFVHTSTCYVNYQLNGGKIIREALYPLPFSPEEMCKRILNMDEGTLAEETPKILRHYGYPNTYTLTKSMSEHILNANRGTVPMAILRPAIIGSALREPKPGWVDTLSASGALFLTAGLGIVKEVHADVNALADIVPVDYVVNGLVLLAHKITRQSRELAASRNQPTARATPLPAPGSPIPLTVSNLTKATAPPLVAEPARPTGDSDNKSTTTVASTVERGGEGRPASLPQMCVVQVGTSGSVNPVTWGAVRRMVVDHWTKNPPKQAISKSKVTMYANRAEYEARFLLKRAIPAAVMYGASKLGGEKMQKDGKRLRKATERAYGLVTQFRPFTNKSWVFDTSSHAGLLDGLSEEDQATWPLDTQEISWHVYIAQYCYGIMKFVLKDEDVQEPHTNHISGAALFATAHL